MRKRIKLLAVILVISALLFTGCNNEGTTGTTDISVTGVELNMATTDIKVGATKTLVKTITPTDATDKSAIWSTSSEAVATVSDTGLVTAVTAGEATITVKSTDGDKTATCVITVTTNISVTGVTLDMTATNIEVGATKTLVKTITPTDATDKSVTWSTSNEAVATVSDNGIVTAVTAGEATITVKSTDGDKTATCVITVSATTQVITDAIIEDFEGTFPTLSGKGWSDTDVLASVKTIAEITALYSDFTAKADSTSTKSLLVENGNYNVLPTLEVELPAGTSLSDYSTLTVDFFVLTDEATYKSVYLYAGTSALTGSSAADGYAVGSDNLIADLQNNPMAGKNTWGVLSFDLTNSAGQTLITALDGSETLIIALGASTADGGDYVLDNIQLIKD